MSKNPRCPRCRLALRRGRALQDVGGGAFAVLILAWKCPGCGYSRERHERKEARR